MSDPSILDPRVRDAAQSLGVSYEVMACDPELADTAKFCEHYGVDVADACNAIVVAIKTEPRSYAACLVRADTKIDVNRKLASIVGTKKLSFAQAEETASITGQMIGGVTIFALPPEMPLLIDTRVMERQAIVVGGGNRSSKIRIDPHALEHLPNARIVDIATPRDPMS